MSYPQYPAAPPPPPPGSGRLRGSTPRKLGWIFLALAVALFVAGGIVIAKKSLSEVNDFQRVTISDGSGSVKIDETGKWIGYYEASNVSSSIDRIPSFNVAVKDPSGANVTIQPYGNRSDGKIDKFTYDYNGHKGAATFQFDAKTKGTYQVTLQSGPDVASGADVAFGRDITTGTIIGALLIVGGIGFLIAAIVLLIVGYVKRSRAKKEREQYSSGYGPPPPGYGPPGYGQGYGPPPPGYNPPPAYGSPNG